MSGVENSVQVTAFDTLINGSLQEFIRTSTALGEPLTTLAKNVKIVFDIARDTLHYGLGNQEPPNDSAVLTRYFNAINELVTYAAVAERTNPDFKDHFATVKESVVAIGWIQMRRPSQFIRDMMDAGHYYSIRVQSANKGNRAQFAWVSNWNSVLGDLLNYVKMHFNTGFTWGTGGSFDHFEPPPPPPPPEFTDRPMEPSQDDGAARQQLMNDLNRGSDITRSLKPVKGGGAVQRSFQPRGVAAQHPAQSRSVLTLSDKPPKTEKIHTPKLALEGKKWVVDYQRNEPNLTISNNDKSESVALYSCLSTTLKVTNKLNNMTIDSCKKLNVVLNDVISGVELIHCSSVKIQLDGKCPIVMLDSCDSVEIYVTADSEDVEIVTSKCSSLNVCVVAANGDLRELAMPEQIKTTIAGQPPRLVSTILDKI